MNKQLARLETSFDNEHHVYTWKQLETWRMILLWVGVGVLWLVILNDLKNFRWKFFEFYFLGTLIYLILYNAYLTVLKTTVEVNAHELKLIKTPFNLLGKNISLETINRVYSERQMLGKVYCVKAELTNGKTKKLFFGLKEEQANELAEHIDKSIKHFQEAQLIPPRNTRIPGLYD